MDQGGTQLLPEGDHERLIETLAGKRVLVVGDLILDHYMTGDVSRISPEAPVPVVSLEEGGDIYVPGGAANVARNIRSLGSEPLMCGIIGDDHEGRKLMHLFDEVGIDSALISTDRDRPTTLKTRIMSRGHQLLRVDREITRPAAPELLEALLERVGDQLRQGLDAVIFEDYDKGTIAPPLLEGILSMASDASIPVVVDPKMRNFFRYGGATLFKPNRREAAQALGREIATTEAAFEAAEEIRRRLDARAVLLTLGSDGSVLCEADAQPFHRPAAARHVFDVSGAGDTVIAVMALALSSRMGLRDASRLANFAAAAVCSEPGVYAVTRQDIAREMKGFDS